MKKFLPIIALAVLIAAGAASVLHHRAHRDTFLTGSRLCMGTTVEVKVPVHCGADVSGIRSAIDAACDEVERIEKVFSAYNDQSEIALINAHAAEGPVRVSDECFALIEQARRYSRKTRGAFKNSRL